MLNRLLLYLTICLLSACSLTSSNGFESVPDPVSQIDEADPQIIRLNEQPTRTPIADVIALPEAARVSSGLGGINANTSLNPTVQARILANLTDANCQPPESWGIYVVQGGDTLYSISRAFSTTIPDLATANCLKDARQIEVGQMLAVPDRNSAFVENDTTERIIGVPQTLDIYMVGTSGGQSGAIPMGCDQWLVPVQISILGVDTAESRVDSAVSTLFAETAPANGITNYLMGMNLEVESVQIQTGNATVNLVGDLPARDACRTPLIRGQIEQTILADHDVNTVTITINSIPIDNLF
jgi:hypothetical protein